MIKLQPLLQASLLTLRPLAPSDFEALYLVAANPKVWEQHPQPDRYKREVFQKYFDGALASQGAFTIIENSSGRVIGSSRYYDLDLHMRTITIGYTFLGSEFWGGKFNQELKTLMLNYAFKFVDAVNFQIGENNLRSRRAIEKIGATLLKSVEIDGQQHAIYQIRKN